MVECLQKSSDIVGNSYVSERFVTVIDEVKQGEALSVAIQRTGIFESMFCSIIYVGEESGALDSILAKSAAFYQEESDEAVGRLVSLIEPVMIIFMGTCIGLVIAGILPAIYNSMGNIQ
jgi:type IV pilus assembly protein PilC